MGVQCLLKNWTSLGGDELLQSPATREPLGREARLDSVAVFAGEDGAVDVMEVRVASSRRCMNACCPSRPLLQ